MGWRHTCTSHARARRIKAALLIALALSCCKVVQVAKAAALDSTSDDNAKAVAEQLIAAFGGTPDALSDLKQQASFILEALGGSSGPGPNPNPGPSGQGPAPGNPAPTGSVTTPASTTSPGQPSNAASQQSGPALSQPGLGPAPGPGPAPASGDAAASQLSSAELAALQAALAQFTSAWQGPAAGDPNPAQPVPATSTGPGPQGARAPGPSGAAGMSPVAGLSDAFSTLASSGFASSLLQSAGSMASSSASNRSSTPRVESSSGFGPIDPLLANAFAPIGSGDNILEFRKRVQAVKEWYREARTYLHIDDAIRIQGYLNTLESLGIAFIAAFPIAELAFFVANVALAASITSLLGGIFYTAASSVGLTASIIGLQAALDAAAAARQEATAEAAAAEDAAAVAAAAAAAAGGRAAPSAGGASPKAAASQTGGRVRAGDAPGDVASGASVSEIVNNKDLVNSLVTASEDLNSQILPWVLGGGALAPMSLATDILGSASASLDRLGAWSPPANVLAGLGGFANTVRPGQGKKK